MTERTSKALPVRDLFDVVATNDLTALLAAVRGVNPFDISPGMHLVQERRRARAGCDGAAANMTPLPYDLDELCIQPDAIATARDARGNTALHVAAGLGYCELVKVLTVECHCPVDAFNDAGYTALHLAASQGRLRCLQFLVNHGANPLVLTRYDAARPYDPDMGRTSLFLAHWHQHHAVVAFLLPFFEAAATLNSSSSSSNMSPPLVQRRPNTAPASATPNAGVRSMNVMLGSTVLDLRRLAKEDEAAKEGKSAAEEQEGSDVAPCAATPGGSLRSKLLRAVLMLDTLVFAQIFDVVRSEMRSAPCGPLPLPWAAQCAQELRRAVLGFLPHIVPAEGDMMAEQLFIFEGLLEHGLLPVARSEGQHGRVNLPATARDGLDVVQRVLRGGQVAAFRILLRRRLVTIDGGHLYSDDIPFDVPDAPKGDEAAHAAWLESSWKGKRTLQHLLREAEAREVVRRCSVAVVRHPQSKTRRAALNDAKAALRALQDDLDRKGIVPLAT